VEQEIAGTENLLHLNVFKSTHHGTDFRLRKSFRARTLKMIVYSLAQGFTAEKSIAQPQHCSCD